MSCCCLGFCSFPAFTSLDLMCPTLLLGFLKYGNRKFGGSIICTVDCCASTFNIKKVYRYGWSIDEIYIKTGIGFLRLVYTTQKVPDAYLNH